MNKISTQGLNIKSLYTSLQNNTNTPKWLEYEYMSIQKHSRDNPDHMMFHWGNLPENLLEDSGYIHDKNKVRKKRMITKANKKAKDNNKPPQEYGLDGLGYCYKSDGKITYLPFQAKFRTSRALTGSSLGTFHIACSNIIHKHPTSIGYLYYTSKLQSDVEEHYDLIKHIKPVKFLYKTNNNINKSEYLVQELHIEQENFLKKLNTDWTGIGLMCLPCGYGKFVIACHFACKYEKIIVISPLCVDTKQSFDRIKPYVTDHNMLLFDSDRDGTTDIQELEKIFNYSKYCICTTEKSAVEVLSKYKYDKDVLFVIDEIHEYNENHKMWDLLDQTEATRLGMTATKTEFLVLNTNELIYMPLSKAIEQKKICDYEIYLPILEGDGENKDFECFIPEELYRCDNVDILSKILFLVTGMHNYGFRHCILYLSTIKECSEYKEMIERVFNEYYGGECIVGIITSDCSSQERINAMNEFNINLKFTFLCSVRILDQNIDIPICDSVFITRISSSTSEVRTLQRLGRSYRLVRQKPTKTAGCFLWTDSDNDLCNMLNMIKSEDPEFYKKVKRISSNYSTQKSIRTPKENYHTQLTKEFVEFKCVSLNERIREKFIILHDHFEKHENPPKRCKKNEETEEQINEYGFAIGGFWSNLLSGHNKELFQQYMKESPNMKKAYDNYLDNKAERDKLVTKTPEEKFIILDDYFEKNENPPKQRKKEETEDQIKKYGFAIGGFWKNLLSGHNKELFQKAMKKSPNMKKAYDKAEKDKSVTKTTEEKFIILIDHFEKDENPPKRFKKKEDKEEQINEYGFDMGKFWDGLRSGNNKEIFQKAMKESPNMKKAYDNYLDNKAERDKLVTKTPEEKFIILDDYFEKNENPPKQRKKEETEDQIKKYGFAIGGFWKNLLSGHNKELFQKAMKKSPNMKKAYDKAEKDKSVTKTTEEKFIILHDHFKDNENPPKQRKKEETEDQIKKYGFAIGGFWKNLLSGHNKELFQKAMKKSPNMKKAYDNYLKNKAARDNNI